jgi:hypothetical protein
MQSEPHINTFNKGMNKDFNVLYQPEGTYRNCLNCQLVSQDGNNYTIKDALGNTRIFQINIPFASFTAGAPNAVTFAANPMPIGFISFPDKLIVFSTNDETDSGGYAEIGEIRFDTYGEGIQPKANSPTNTYSGYVPLYHHISLKFTKQRQIEGFAFEESESIQRVYWTDHLNEPRVFNVSDPIFTTYISSGSLVSTEQYMILEGVLEHPVGSGTYYGPGLPNGNIFTAAAATYTAQTGGNIPTTPKVIAYYPYQLLNFTPSRSLGTIKYKAYGVGDVLCGSKIYFYRLSDPDNGLFTSWSYGSAPIQVTTTNSVTPAPANNYFSYSGGGTPTATLNSGRSVQIDISNIDTNFVRIQVACAEFDQILETPRLISIVEDTLITGTDMVLEHTGNVNLGDLTLEDITLFPASIITCKTMTTNKNYILIGNLTEREELDWDDSTVTKTEISSSFAVHEVDVTSCPNVLTYTDLSIYSNPTFIIEGQQYLVVSDGGGAVVYNATNYAANTVFTGLAGVTAVTIPAGSELRACVYRNRYTTTGGTLRPEVIYNLSGFLTYKDPARAHHKKGYWANDTYRFCILFYDLKGNPMYVRHLADHTFSSYLTNDLIDRRTTGAYDYWFLNQRAISFSGIRIPSADVGKISGFSIVRCERDKRIITEGMVVQVGASGNLFRPMAGPDPQTDSVWLTSVNPSPANPACNYYVYISPDKQVEFPMTNYSVGSYMEGGFFLDPAGYGGAGVDMKAEDINTQWETRYMLQTNDAAVRKQKIVTMATVDEGQGYANFGTDNYAFINSLEFGALGSSLVDNSCVSGVPGTFNPDGYKAEGCKVTVVELDSFLYDYTPVLPPTVAYGDLTAAGTRRLMIDVTIDKTNPYGGNSDTALASSIYISTGHFQPITSAVISDTNDTGNPNAYNYLEFNNVEIWGGDCYTCLITIGAGLYNVDMGTSYSWGVKFPCQCNSNYDLRRGRTVETNKMYKGIADNGVWYNDGTTAQLESYELNEAYSSVGVQFAYPALPVNFLFDNQYKFRIRFAGEKFPNETRNTFRTFLPFDFKDVDGQGGEINNLATKDGKTFVWQNAIISSVPILERQLLAGGSGAPTTIGTGGVVDRFDPLSSYFGNQHQHGLTKTEFGFVWFDMRRKAVVAMDTGSGIAEISKIDGLKSYFDEIIVDNLGSYVQSEILNSPTFEETSDRPLIGVGITGVYDPKFKMTYLTFKFINHVSGDPYIKLNKDFTIGYYHPDRLFVGFYDFTPAIAHNHNQIVIAANNPKNKTVYYGTGMVSTNFVISNVVAYDGAEYICIADVTVAGYRLDTSKEPGTAGTAYWTKINATNELWVHNQPTTLGQVTAPDYLYNKIFGQVVNNELEYVVNPKVSNPFNVTNMEALGNNAFPTAVYIEAGSQTASDTSIRTTSNYYRYIWDRICSNMPLSSTGRIVNNYLKVKIVKQNWTTPNPTTVTGTTKYIQMIKSFFTQKR